MNGKSGDRLGVANTVCLVENNTIPVVLLELSNVGDEPVVVTEKDRRPQLLLADWSPPGLLGHVEIQITTLNGLFPLLPDSEWHQNQSSLDPVIDNKTKGLDRLAKAHFVTQNSTVYGYTRTCLESDPFLIHHPSDTFALVARITNR